MSNLQFQVILEAGNIFLGTTPDGKKMRAIITGLEEDQLDRIIDSLIDAGPEVTELFLKKFEEKYELNTASSPGCGSPLNRA